MSDSAKNNEAQGSGVKGVSRRTFVAATAVGIVVGAAVGAGIGALGFPKTVTKTSTTTSTTTASGIPTSWDQTADVVVVGYGGAGAVTAITAHDAGADVLVLEKSPSLASLGVTSSTASGSTSTSTTVSIQGGGGNTHLSEGNIIVPTNASEIANFLYSASFGTTPMDVCTAWANQAININSWLTGLGIKYSTVSTPLAGGFANIPGASGYSRSTVTGGGLALFAALDAAVQSRGITVLFNTPASSLIQNAVTGEIVGVYATSGSSTISIRANKAVVLCCGSFEYDETTKANYLRGYPAHFEGWIYNTGDGVKMAQKVGAGLWHMNAWSAALAAWFPGHGPMGFGVSPKANGWIYVDTTGNRFCNESDVSGYGDSYANDLTNFNMDSPQYARIPTFLIFDDTTRAAGAIGPTSLEVGYAVIPSQLGGSTYIWSSDNSAEIASGWIIKGETSISDLANAINSATIASVPANTVGGPSASMTFNISPTVLTDSVNAYNSYCAAGIDSEFGRPASTLTPIQTAPFYAVPLWPGGPNNMGGPIRNASAQVCDPYNNPIPRLYSSGECGSIWGFLYPGAGNLSEVIAFGQIAGNNAAAETPWNTTATSTASTT